MGEKGASVYDRCPCCGGTLVGSEVRWIKKAGILVWDTGACTLTGMEAVVLDILWRARASGEPIPTERILSVAYTGRNPPDWARGALGVRMTYLRRKLREAGLAMTFATGGYRLTAVQPRPRLPKRIIDAKQGASL